MKKILTLLFSLLIHFVNAQNFNPKTIALSENPIDIDFNFLKEELKDVQVVMLGEKTHFDGNVFEMKTKIVKFLHQEMGFNTIAFESGIYDVWKAEKDINNGSNTQEVFINSLFSIWAKRNEFQSFIHFYDENKKGLNLFGFDTQITGTNGHLNLSRDLFGYSKKINYKFKFKKTDFELLLESIINSSMFDETDITYNQFKSELISFQNAINKQKDSEENFYWKQIVKSLLELGNDVFTKVEISSSFNTTAFDNNRDKQMADNLLAYLKQNPNAKIICWGANAHFANNMSSINEPFIKDFIPMGSYIKNELKNKVYSLACVTAVDSIFLQNNWHETPIRSDSFEGFLKQKQSASPHAFISSNQIEMQNLVWNRLFSPITFVESKLNELHDGYFYFRNVAPSTLLDSEERHKISYKNKYVKSNSSEFENEEKSTSLNEVVVYGKRTAYQIIKNAIESFDKNYPDNPFNSIMTTKIQSKIADSIYLDFDFIADQHDLGYVNHVNRSSKKITQLRWNIKSDFQTESLQEYHGLMYNSPIKYAPFLKIGKFKKFVFEVEETKIYNNEEVYVINFSSPRNHSTFTRRVYLSNYSGYLYVNKKDFAIAKIFENWTVTEFPEQFKTGFNLRNGLSKFTSKEYTNESTTTYFSKIDNVYFITHATNSVTGHLYDKKMNKENFSIIIDSHWDEFNMKNPIQIQNKYEELIFEKIKYNEQFWKTYSSTN